MSRVEKVEKVRLGDHLDFSNGHTSGHTSPASEPGGRYPVYGANGVIGYSAQHNARGPLIVVGRVGSYCGSLRYCDSDVWVTDNALACRAKKPEETRYWYYALLGFGLNRYRAGSGQPLLSQGVLRNVSVSAVAAPDRPRIGEILGAFDDKIAANDRVIEAAEALMLAIVGRLSAYVPLSSLASRSTACLDAQHFDSTVAHYSFAAFDGGAQPSRVGGRTIRSAKLVVSQPCVLFPKLNPRIRPVSTSATPTATPWPRSPGSRCCFVAMTSRIPISGPRAPEPRLRYIRYMHRGYALVVCSPGVTRTMIDIDDDLLARAAKELGTTTKKDTVHAALRAALRASAARSLMNRMAENATGTQDEALVNAMWRDGHPENTA